MTQFQRCSLGGRVHVAVGSKAEKAAFLPTCLQLSSPAFDSFARLPLVFGPTDWYL